MRTITGDPGFVLDPMVVNDLTDRILAEDDAEHLMVRTPLSGRPLAEIPMSTPSDVACAVQRARPAQRVWYSLRPASPRRDRAGLP